MKELAVKAAYDADFLMDLEDSNSPHDVVITAGVQPDRKFWLLLDIGEVDRDWTEHFSVLVCTPADRPRNDPSARFLLVQEYDAPAVRAALVRTVKSCERDTWEECLSALRKRFKWEYD
ncbi:Imm8 family immunity protein [Rhizobium sp. YIM 134829]|uniref:Imm8 family immunity protein n=1 Tax=Rhizobium sp. YIM 134829 TaxID=3390453 RepID=UPI00397D5CAF